MDAKPRFFDLTQRMIYLRSIPVAAVLPNPVLKIVASHLRELSFAPGERLMREGEPIHGLHLLLEGSVALVKQGALMGRLTPPQSVGFLGILSRGPAGYDATAESEVHSLELPADALLELMEDHPALLAATLRYLSERQLQELKEMPVEALEGRLVGDDPERLARSLDLVERILYVRGLNAFAHTNLNAVAAMARQMAEERFPMGREIWRNGEVARQTMFIVTGRVRCDDGVRSWRAGANSVIGGFEVIARQPRWYTLRAETEVVAYTMHPDTFIDLLEDDFGMAMDFVSMLANVLTRILDGKAAAGMAAYSTKREVTTLGAVPVGAG